MIRPYLRRLALPVRLAALRRTTPLSAHWGFDRGTPIDRYYIEQFLEAHRRDIRGRVLEVKDGEYTARYGSGVERGDVLDIDPSNREATIVADLSAGEAVLAGQFDCFILTQTLQFIYDVEAGLAGACRLLRTGGVLLATVPGVSRLDRHLTDYWRFTPASCLALASATFGSENVTLTAYGNVLTATAFLTGLAAEELGKRRLERHDDLFPVLLAIRATKPAGDRR